MNTPIQGHLDLQHDDFTINGWLAAIGDPSPRTALIRIDGVELKVEASLFRADLAQHGINDGRHAFSVDAPYHLVDGRERMVELVDAGTGQQVHQVDHHWGCAWREFVDMQGFLRHSMTQPITTAPFTERDGAWRRGLEAIAEGLCRSALEGDNAPLVSVVMPTYNRSTIVGTAIRSVLAQRYENFELLVVDDGSTDGTADVAESMRDPRIRTFRTERNAGHAAARNRGLKESSGSIIAYLDSDNHWDSRYLAAVVGAFHEIPDADAIATGQLLYWGDHPDPLAIRYGHINLSLLENRNYIDLNSFAHRKECIQETGRFNPQLRRFVDYDFVLRFTETKRVWSVPAILTHYHFDKADGRVSNNEDVAHDLDRVHEDRHARGLRRLGRPSPSLGTPVALIVLGEQEPPCDTTPTLPEHCVGTLRFAPIDPAASVQPPQGNDSGGPALRQGRPFWRNDLKAERRHIQAFLSTLPPQADILVLQDGVTLQPGALQELQRTVHTRPDAGAAVPRLELPANTAEANQHAPYADSRRPVDVGISMLSNNLGVIGTYHDGGPVTITSAPAVAAYVRRDAYNRMMAATRNARRQVFGPMIYQLIREAALLSVYYVPSAHASVASLVLTEKPSPAPPKRTGPWNWLRRRLERS